MEAVAGSGKTTALVEGFKYVSRGKKSIALAFNKNIQTELRNRAPSYIQDVLTFHSLGLRSIKQRFKNIVIDNYKVFNIVKESGECGKQYDLMYSICDTVAYCKYELVDTPDAIEQIMMRFGIDLCEMDQEHFIKMVIQTLAADKNITEVIDFDDMCYFPFIHNLPMGQYDYVFVDEFQDMNRAQAMMATRVCKPDGGRIIMAGDTFQCVEANTMLDTPTGQKTVQEVKIGDLVASYENGKITQKKIINKVKSDWVAGIKITTQSGKSLTMSPNHKIWAEQQKIDAKFLVYLMYRHDLGFRVGKTNKWKDDNNAFGARALHEQADKLWVIEIVNTNEEALLAEESYSLTYGIPTSVFNAEDRGINQERVNEIFNRFGQNGHKLLMEKHLSFDLPHWIGKSRSTSLWSRLVVRISAHGHKGMNTSVFLEVSDQEVIAVLVKNGITGKRYKRRPYDLEHFQMRKQFAAYTDAFKFAVHLAKLIDAYISENLSLNVGDGLRLITTSGLFVGMKVVSNIDGKAQKDEIVAIEKVAGQFFDLEIEDTANFFGNQILSHNSLYSWRGVDTTVIKGIRQEPTTRILTLPISYRCPKQVVELVKPWVNNIEAAPNAKEGEIKDISLNEMYKKAQHGCFVLSRLNAPLIKVCMSFIRAGKRCNIQGRDIGKQLISLIKKSKKKQIPAFLTWLNTWKNEEVAKIMEKGYNPENVIDRYDCLVDLCDEFSSLEEVKEKIEELFDDSNEKNIIVCSSVHRAKGKERDVVFLLKWTFQIWFDDLAELKEYANEDNEPANIVYVAGTRTKDKLYLVSKF